MIHLLVSRSTFLKKKYFCSHANDSLYTQIRNSLKTPTPGQARTMNEEIDIPNVCLWLELYVYTYIYNLITNNNFVVGVYLSSLLRLKIAQNTIVTCDCVCNQKSPSRHTEWGERENERARKRKPRTTDRPTNQPNNQTDRMEWLVRKFHSDIRSSSILSRKEKPRKSHRETIFMIVATFFSTLHQ